MNNDFYTNNWACKSCCPINKCCTTNFQTNCQTSNCCPQPKPQPCCPTTITVGTTTTSAPGTQASVNNVGTPTNAILNFVIPAGETGATGPQGPTGATGATGAQGPAGTAATITVGTTTTGDPGTPASVTNVGTSSNAIFNFVIPAGEQGIQGPTGATGATGPQGPAGADGTAATITVGTTTTGDPGTQATVTNVGSNTNAIFDFVIPAGEPGTITPGVAVPTLEATATLTDVINTVNALITSLTNAGFLA